MANEATIVTLLGNAGDPIRYTVASGVAISAGTLLYLVDPVTASGSHTGVQNAIPVGIAAADKSSSDGATTISAYTNGIFDIVAAGTAITLGDEVQISGSNLISGATGVANKSQVLGVALETASASERIAVRIRL